MNEIEKHRVNRKLDSKEKIVIKALTEKIASLKAANKNLHKRVSILKRKIERNRDNITE
jgi:cell division protein FtsB